MRNFFFSCRNKDLDRGLGGYRGRGNYTYKYGGLRMYEGGKENIGIERSDLITKGKTQEKF